MQKSKYSALNVYLTPVGFEELTAIPMFELRIFTGTLARVLHPCNILMEEITHLY